jgi:hypothetical protein
VGIVVVGIVVVDIVVRMLLLVVAVVPRICWLENSYVLIIILFLSAIEVPSPRNYPNIQNFQGEERTGTAQS